MTDRLRTVELAPVGLFKKLVLVGGFVIAQELWAQHSPAVTLMY
jgi:hypothetical protein